MWSGRTISHVHAGVETLDASKRPEHIIVTVVTDGMENASKEWSRLQVADSVKAPKEREEALHPRGLEGTELLAHVAETYRLGVLVGQSPTQLVAEQLGMSRAAAGRWISRAREEGFLGPAVGTKAGEVGG
jgi:hypothetical protein